MSIQSRFLLFKRANGFYYILFDQDGRRRWKSTGCTLKHEAIKSLTEFEQLFQQKQKEVTLSQFSADFLSFAKGNFAKCTVDFYRTAFDHLKSMVGDIPLSSLTMQHIDLYKVKRLADNAKYSTANVSGATVNRELQALRAAMNTAVSWKHLEHNPFSKMAQVQIPEVTPSYFTKQDFQRLLNAITEEWLKELVVFAVLTGMRRGELVNLRWQDVDLQRKLIQIQSSPTFRTKQGKRRVVPMSEVVFNLLGSKAQRIRSEYIFHIKGYKINDDHASKKLKKYVGEAKLDPKLHFHSLRHTFASWLVQDGVSLYELQKLLGHSNIAVTQVYSHLQPEGLHSTVNRISLSLN